MQKFLCRLGLHDWTLWVSGTRTNQVLVTDYRAHHSVAGRFHDVTQQIQIRQCKACGLEQQRRVG